MMRLSIFVPQPAWSTRWPNHGVYESQSVESGVPASLYMHLAVIRAAPGTTNSIAVSSQCHSRDAIGFVQSLDDPVDHATIMIIMMHKFASRRRVFLTYRANNRIALIKPLDIATPVCSNCLSMFPVKSAKDSRCLTFKVIL